MRAHSLLLTSLLIWALCSLPAAARELSFDDRVLAQEIIERIYYSHQLETTRLFEDAVPRKVLENKVREYLELSAVLDRFWATPLTGEMLGRELERIAANTRFPDRLREIYAALGHDPVLVHEALARPSLVRRMARSFFRGDRRAQRSTQPRSWDEWWAEARKELDPDFQVFATGGRPLPSPGSQGLEAAAPCLPDDTWNNGVLYDTPDGNFGTTPVWTGTLMIVWGGRVSDLTDRGSRYDPLLDSWAATSRQGAPSPRTDHTAVWTGTEMVIWGGTGEGSSKLGNGARYEPLTDSWTPVSAVNAPEPRSIHTAVFNGSEMIVWGGFATSYVNSGGRYDPATDTWGPISLVGAPSPRGRHVAVWAGGQHPISKNRMIIWSGTFDFDDLDTGGVYDPVQDTWAPMTTTGAPTERRQATAVWTGDEMIVWGGRGGSAFFGGRYDPNADVWLPIADYAPLQTMYGHTAVWTGDEMIVWGGIDVFTKLAFGGRYDPRNDTWTPTSMDNVPAGRFFHAAVWTGDVMVVWGGSSDVGRDNSGGRYDPDTDTWTPTSVASGPSPRSFHQSVWTGNFMIAWGGQDAALAQSTGERYDPLLDSWSPVSTAGGPSKRIHFSAVWTGQRMVVWGGIDSGELNGGTFLRDGGRYDPISNSWLPTTLTSAPTARSEHSAVWTGSRMLVWGGFDLMAEGTGASYDPWVDVWSPITETGSPTPRSLHAAAWTGEEMLIWAGDGSGSTYSGARYDPSTDSWSPMSTDNGPPADAFFSHLWTGEEWILWGGGDSGGEFQQGSRYDPDADSWTYMSTTGAPSARGRHAAVWTGNQMLVWGGNRGIDFYNDGGRYDPVTDTWSGMSVSDAPHPRSDASAVWTGNEMIVWGGRSSVSFLPTNGFATGGRYSIGHMADVDQDGFSVCDGDCDDSDGATFPGAPETCDWRDNNCDGVVDEGLDDDLDGVAECSDNCPGFSNPGQEDTDNDSIGDDCDCDPDDPAHFAVPGEIARLEIEKAIDPGQVFSLSWTSAAPSGGNGVVHQVLQGSTSDLPVGSAATEFCTNAGSGTHIFEFNVPPLGEAIWFLVRGSGSCGPGTYGFASGGAERTSSTCL